MSMTRTIDQMVSAARKAANAEGTTALQRHPDADLFDYVNRGIAALYRLLTRIDAGQRYLSSTTISTVAGTETYSLPADFQHLVSLGGEVNGAQRWLVPYNMNERPYLVDDNAGWQGEPFHYRLRGSNISLLPVPQDAYDLTLWYTAAPSTLTTGQTFDTIARLDDFVVLYAAKLIALKDKNFDLHAVLDADLQQMRGEVEAIGAQRDHNHPQRITDVSHDDWRYHRRMRAYRGS